MSDSSRKCVGNAVAPRSFAKLQSHENRDTQTAKWLRRGGGSPAGPVRSCRGGTYLARPAIPGRVSRDPFSLFFSFFFSSLSTARRNYESRAGPDAGVLTAAVHDEVSRWSRFLESGCLVARARARVLAANDDGEMRGERP